MGILFSYFGISKWNETCAARTETTWVKFSPKFAMVNEYQEVKGKEASRLTIADRWKGRSPLQPL